MRVLVVLGHQNTSGESFCHAIAEAVVEELRAAGHEVVFHDLYAERFDAILPQSEIPKQTELEPVIRRHCDEVAAADGFVVIHPNWWGQPPAILKGWIDRVFRQGVVYEFTADGVSGRLQGRRAVVITTSNTPRDVEVDVFGDPLENLWKACVFGFCGLEDFVRRNFESIVLSNLEDRRRWLEETRELVRARFPATRNA
jgi:putative NADPH-quinone reductase